MPVPNSVHFGPSENGEGLTYGHVRNQGEEAQFQALNRRFNTLFIGQVDELTKEENGKRVVYSPFPLFLMTCVGIETLGKIFFSREPKNRESEEDIQREGFLEVCSGFDQAFSRKLSKDQKSDYDSLWGIDEHKKVRSVAVIIYRLGRHTMVHGYRGKGVFLTEHKSVPTWSMKDGAVILNPYWFWKKYKSRSSSLWKDFHDNKEPTNAFKRSARLYLQEILN